MDIEKNNELFSNALAYNIVWREKFASILYSQWKEKDFIGEYIAVVEWFLEKFKKQLDTM